MAKHQDTDEEWAATGGPAVDHVIDAAKELAKLSGMTFGESVDTIIETVYQRLSENKIVTDLTQEEIRVILDVIDDWEAADRYCTPEWERDKPLVHSAYDKLLKIRRWAG